MSHEEAATAHELVTLAWQQLHHALITLTPVVDDRQRLVLVHRSPRRVRQVCEHAGEGDHLIGGRLLVDDSGHHQIGIVRALRGMTAPLG